MQSQVRLNRVPEKVWEPGQVQQGSGEGSGEGLGGFGAEIAEPSQVQQGFGEGSGEGGGVIFFFRIKKNFFRIKKNRSKNNSN